jgi:hypothetical protein
MRELTKLQDKIEKMAKNQLAKDINELDTEFRDLIRKYNNITCDITIKVQDKDGKVSMPYLVQLFRNEAVLESIKDKYLPDYVDVMVTKLLEK